jgi:hypothetical protein
MKPLRIKNRIEKIDPDSIPILASKESLDAIGDGFDIVEVLSYPQQGTGGIYTGSFFESFVNSIKERPIPGDKNGHSEHPKDDFFVIGGKTENTSAAEGNCYLRIRIPEMGYETSNSGFIRSCKTGNQLFSIVAEVDPQRNTAGEVFFIEATGTLRNDAVSRDAAMHEQTVSNSATEKELMDLISRGEIDIDSDTKELTANGKVCRKAALHMQFNGPDKTLGARLMNAIAKKLNHKEKNQVTKEEIIAAIKAAIANSTLTLEEISQAVGMENKLKNATDEQRAKLVAAIAEALELPADTPTEELLKAAQAAFDEAEQAAESVVEAEAVNVANGKKIKNADGTEVDNPAYLYAKDKLKGQRGQVLKNSIESLKKDAVMLSLRSKQADSRVTVGGKKTDGDDSSLDLEV